MIKRSTLVTWSRRSKRNGSSRRNRKRRRSWNIRRNRTTGEA